MMHKQITIAVAGNPNCGKTTVFNALTGARQQVGNWPGVTIEHVEGDYSYQDHDVRVVDLPGIYSFSAFSLDEKVAREYILHERPDVVVNIIDATNLERNLYLTTQLLEMRVPIVVGLNMSDLARQRRIAIEVDHLSAHLGCPVIPLSAHKGVGIDALRAAVNAVADAHGVPSTQVSYDSELEESLALIAGRVADRARAASVDARWLAIKLMEHDEVAREFVDHDIDQLVAEEGRRIEKHTGDELDLVVADGRYGFIHGLVRDVVRHENRLRRTMSDAIDRVVLHRGLGIPLFLFALYVMFALTIGVGGPFIDFFDLLCGTIFVDGVRAVLGSLAAPGWLITFLADGVGGGIQTVSTFIPPIFFIFLGLSFLEDSGYMARAAFVMDRLLRAIGLPGKAFLPLLIGFGCNVPAILASRTLENERDRRLTVLINPFMSCGARLPVYTLFAVAFFPTHGGALIFGLYAVGIVVAILSGLLFKHTILHGEPTTFVMELPPYHLPTVRGILHHTWHKLRGFIVRAGRVIVAVVVLMGMLNVHTGEKLSLFERASRRLTPIFRPMGITDDNWPATVGLFSGVFAKEAVVGTLDSLYRQLDDSAPVGDESQAAFDFWAGIRRAFQAIPNGFRGFSSTFVDPTGLREVARGLEGSAAVAPSEDAQRGTLGLMHRFFPDRVAVVAYLLFILLYMPCLAAVAAMYREIGLRWTLFAVVYQTGLAWIVATLCYQFGTFFAHPTASFCWILGCALFLAGGVVALRVYGRRHGRAQSD